MKILCCLVLFALVGCATEGYYLRKLSDDQLREVKTKTLVLGYYDLADERVRAEIDRRGLFTEREWELVRERKISVGMSQVALYAAWGRPSGESLHETRDGYRMQHSYGGYNGAVYIPMSFVYTENGRVTGWSK